MRGSVFHSPDAGDSWTRAKAYTQAGITSGAFLADGTLLLGSLSGGVARSVDKGETFESVKLAKSMPFFGLTVTPSGKVTLVGAAGIQNEAVKLENQKDAASALVNSSVGTGKQWEAGHGYAN
ncbi:hypothetical protein D3C78_1582130 [compost metagenome]